MSAATAIIIPFPRRPETRASGVRAAQVAGGWCVERLAGGSVTHRTRMPGREDAQRVAARVSRRDRVALLPARGSMGDRP